MATRGYLFSLGRDDAKQLFGLRGDQAVLSFVGNLRQQGKSLDCGMDWQMLDRCLTAEAPGSVAESDAAPGPLGLTFLGGRPLASESEQRVALVRPDLVPHVATALAAISEDDLRQRFERLFPSQDELLPLVVDLLATVRQFYDQAAGERAAVVFAALDD